jgi:hypothetical protein
LFLATSSTCHFSGVPMTADSVNVNVA